MFLHMNHDLPSAGHFGWRKTLERLKNNGYWIGMAKDVQQYCRSCSWCMESKQYKPAKVLLVSSPIGNPWKRIAVDVLEVPMNSEGNRYILVIQDYFTKWMEAFPMPDQKSDRIVRLLNNLFCRLGIPEELHSDQGRNFESALLSGLCSAFGIKKTHTTPYHPQGDGLVERANRTLLNMLRTYVDREDQWEQYLALILYAYNTSFQSSIETTPFNIMYGREPELPLVKQLSFDTTTYKFQLQEKMRKCRQLVEERLINAARDQKRWYDKFANRCVKFKTGILFG